MRVRVIFLDFGGTLCATRAELAPIFAEAARKVGVTLPMAEYVRANDACWDELWPQAPLWVGQTPAFADRVHELALRRIGFRGPIDAVVQAIRAEAIAARTHHPFPETERTLRELKGRGYPLHVISGHVDYLPLIIENLGWAPLFETVTFSQEVGAQKPDPRVFRFALARARVPPAEAVYVGDTWQADYAGATAVGMQAVWLNRDGRTAPGPCREISTLEGLLELFPGPPGAE